MDLDLLRSRLAGRRTYRQKKSDETEQVDLGPLLKSQPLLQDIKLTGFEDDLTRRLIIADHFLRKQARQTLVPLLPLLLSLKGKPYTLENHFPFEPFFRTRIAKATLLKTGRQVSKSTSLAAQGVVLSNCIPYFSTLYVTPLFEQIRRFSQNYVRPFIETSPVTKLFSGTTTTNSVLQKTFHNHAQMLFSFAFLDAERTRGVPADCVNIDESVCGITTYVNSMTGKKLLKELRVGEFVESVNPGGKLVWSKVLAVSYHGFRRCWRLTTNDGHALDCTADSYVLTSEGWKRVSDIIERAFQSATAAANSGDHAGRCTPDCSRQDTQVSQQPRLVSTPLQSSKVHDLVRVRKQTSRETQERRLREMVEYLSDQKLPRIVVFSRTMHQVEPGSRSAVQQRGAQTNQDSNTGVATGDRKSGDLGNSCLVGRRRRLSGRKTLSHDVAHTRVYSGRSTATGILVEQTPDRMQSGCGPQQEAQQDVLDRELHRRRYEAALRTYTPLRATVDELQGYTLSEARHGGLFVLRPDFSVDARTDQKDGQSTGGYEADDLRPSRMSLGVAPMGRSKIHSKSGKSKRKTTKRQETLLRKSGRKSQESSRKKRTVPTQAPGTSASQQTKKLAQETSGTPGSNVDLSTLPDNRASGHTHFKDQVLQEMPRRSQKRTKTSIRAEETYWANCEDMPRVLSGIRSHQQPSGILHAEVQEDGCKSFTAEEVSTTSENREDMPGLSEDLHTDRIPTEGLQQDMRSEPTLDPVEITSIEYVGEHDVYDIEVEGNHTFIGNGLAVANCQNMDFSFLPIIGETMSASDWGLWRYAGTPLTLDNTIERLWLDSSMAEWCIPCERGGCNHWNIPALEFDLIDMIGPWHSNIGPDCPGVICAKCRKPINPRHGRWIHRYPAKRWKFAGYHVPQIIMPMHYASVEKWEVLLGKMAGRGNTPINVFYNEVCGESYDSGSKLITVTDLKRAACLPWSNRVDDAKAHIDDYDYRICAVDWGGGGAPKGSQNTKRAQTNPGEVYNSYTSIAVIGVTGDGKYHVIFGLRSIHPHEHVFEAKLILGIMRHFKCSHLVHDFTGAGATRETIIHQAGLPYTRIIPVRYVGPLMGPIIQLRQPKPALPKAHFRCDRSRSLTFTCQMIKSGILKFFQYDHHSNEDPGLLHDFLALIEQKGDGRAGPDPYVILRDPNNPDDFAQAVNIGVMYLCFAQGKWPDLASAEGIEYA